MTNDNGYVKVQLKVPAYGRVMGRYKGELKQREADAADDPDLQSCIFHYKIEDVEVRDMLKFCKLHVMFCKITFY